MITRNVVNITRPDDSHLFTLSLSWKLKANPIQYLLSKKLILTVIKLAPKSIIYIFIYYHMLMTASGVRIKKQSRSFKRFLLSLVVIGRHIQALNGRLVRSTL